MNLKDKFILIVILSLGIFLRLYKIDNIPPGLNIDEASYGYSAYSILLTGKDRYGEFLPLEFRSFGTYLLPLYAYLSLIPIAIFGPTIYSVRAVAISSSILLIFISAILIFKFAPISKRAKFLSILLLCISPWAIYFGRGAHEASLAVMLFSISILSFFKSLSNPKWLPLSAFFSGLAGLSYYSERYLTIIIFPLLVFLFKEKFIKYKKIIFLTIFIFVAFQLPSLALIKSAAFVRRIEQVNYLTDASFYEHAGVLKEIPLGRTIYSLKEFSTHYIEYLSPRSLFYSSDPQFANSTPDLSVFYVWMALPFLVGLAILIRNATKPFFKIILTLLIISPIPAALTTEPFYSLRILVLLWVLTIVIAQGCDFLLSKIKSKFVSLFLIISLLIISLVSFYNSYFIFLKYERGDVYGYQYRQLVYKLNEYKDKKIVIDSGRFIGVHIWIPFYAKVDPKIIQSQTPDFIKNNYYNDTNLDVFTKINNIEIGPIIWKNDLKDEILIGDSLAISEAQINEHKLKEIFEISGSDGKIRLKGYKTKD